MLTSPAELATTLSTRLSRAEPEIAATRALWREVYSDEFGWLPPDSDPASDRYHARALYAVTRTSCGTPVGTLRIVHAADPDLYITRKLGVGPLGHHATRGFEVQRLMVKRAYRDKRLRHAPFGVYGALVKVCLHYALAAGADWVLADCHRDIALGPLKSMKAMGFRETTHSYRDEINGEECVVLIVETRQWISNTIRKRTRFNRYLFPDDNTISMEN